MGYDLHITRRANWSGTGDDISAEEWLSFVASDPELHLRPESGPFFAVWSGPSTLSDPWLDWFNGEIRTKNPDQPLVNKMVAVASSLGAVVQGDDGEVYHLGGQPPEISTPTIGRRFARWLDRARARLTSRPKLPPPPFRVGDRVANSSGELATIQAIDRRAEHGYGTVRVRFDDGREQTCILFAHGLTRVGTEPA